MRKSRTIKKLIEDKYGLLYSTELLLSLILLVFIIGIIANVSDNMNEKALSQEELSSLEKISVEAADYLLNNPGNPDNWEKDEGLNNNIVSSKIIPGLAIKDKDVENGFFYDESNAEEKVIQNSISYYKLSRLESNYDELINQNLFNGSLRSSISIYPIDSSQESISMGDELNEEEKDVLAVKRTVKMNYYNDFVIYRFNDLELYGESYNKSETCNHDTNPNLMSHENDGRSIWLCKSFRIYQSSLNDYDYYLISDDSINQANCKYILESLNRTSDEERIIDQDIIELNPFFTSNLENSSEDIFSIHFNIPKEDMDKFKSVLVAVPKNMTKELASKNQLKYDYFNSKEVNFVLKTSYR